MFRHNPKKFNHFKVPPTWESWFTDYPEGFTILEAIMSWLRSSDDLIDSFNSLSELVSNFLKYAEAEISDKVLEIINEWDSSGKLEAIINQALMNGKADKKDITQNVMWYGVLPDSNEDQSQRVQAMFDMLPEGSHVRFPKGVYNFGDVTLKPNTTVEYSPGVVINGVGEFVFRAVGSLATVGYKLASVARFGDKSVTIDEAYHDIKPNDLVQLEDDTRRLAGDSKINIEILRVQGVNGNIITFTDELGAGKELSTTMNLRKVNAVKGLSFIGTPKLIANNPDTSKGGFYFLDYCEDVYIEGGESFNTARTVVGLIRCYNVKVGSFYFNGGRNAEAAGAAYGLLMMFCRYVTIGTLRGWGMRHIFDNGGSYHITCDHVIEEYGLGSAVILAHNSYGGWVDIRKIDIYNAQGIAVMINNQGLGESDTHIVYGIHLGEVFIDFAGSDTSLAVVFNHIVRDSHIGSLRVVNRKVVGGSAIKLAGFGNELTISDLYVKNMTYAVAFAYNTIYAPEGALRINSLNATNCTYLIGCGNGCEIVVDNVVMKDVPNFVYFNAGCNNRRFIIKGYANGTFGGTKNIFSTFTRTTKLYDIDINVVDADNAFISNGSALSFMSLIKYTKNGLLPITGSAGGTLSSPPLPDLNNTPHKLLTIVNNSSFTFTFPEDALYKSKGGTGTVVSPNGRIDVMWFNGIWKEV